MSRLERGVGGQGFSLMFCMSEYKLMPVYFYSLTADMSKVLECNLCLNLSAKERKKEKG